ncbi:hypothetical protein CO641_02495 [Lysobacteraceae bacterium NML91-0213]|nr:hypothetical protein CO641_02495 [Xanthomonadaceae bacterium NML91-0213]
MALTVGLTSMDKATETALRAAFDAANSELQGHFQLLDETAADYVVIDMDSMYGPMGWLRLHAAGKQVIGLTSAPRTQADFRLGRPFDTVAMISMLREVAAHAGVDLAALAESVPAGRSGVDAATAAPAVAAMPAVEPGGVPTVPSVPPAVPVQVPEPAPAADDAHASAAAPVAASGSLPPVPEAPEPAPTPVAARLEPAVEAPRERGLFDWLLGHELRGRVRLQCTGSPALWIDADAQTYVGPAQLKPLDACFAMPLERDAFEPVDDAAWNAGTAGSEARPLSRLTWYGGLLAGDGRLLPGSDPDGRYQLLKWPQTEREFPRHFRIATAMMKGPATLAEIAEASGTPLPEVTDFVNANLATGFAEPWVEPQPEVAPPPRQGLFSRFIRK